MGGGKKSNALAHLRADDGEAADVREDLHDHVAVGHPAVDLEVFEVGRGVELHALEDLARLEGVRLEGGKCDMGRRGV